MRWNFQSNQSEQPSDKPASEAKVSESLVEAPQNVELNPEGKIQHSASLELQEKQRSQKVITLPARDPEDNLGTFSLGGVSSISPDVIESDRTFTKVCQLEQFGSYSFIFDSAAKKFTVYDETGRDCTDRLSQSLELGINWPDLIKKYSGSHSGYSYIVLGSYISKQAGDFDCTLLPPELRKEAEALIKKTGSNPEWVQVPGPPPLLPLPTEKMVTPDGQYLIFCDAVNFLFIAIQVRDEQGNLLQPRNWSRFDSSSENLPPNLKKYLTENLSITRGVGIPFSDNYSVKVTDSQIAIYDFTRPGEAVFEDALTDIGTNITNSSVNPGIIYYCTSNAPREIVRLDLSDDDPATWRSKQTQAPLPESFEWLEDLKLDPTGSLFTCRTNKGFTLLDKDTLEVLAARSDLLEGQFDDQGNLHALSDKGELVTLSLNLDEYRQVQRQQRTQQLLQGLTIPDPFVSTSPINTPTSLPAQEQFAHLVPVRDQLIGQFTNHLNRAGDFAKIEQVRAALGSVTSQFQAQGLESGEVTYLTTAIKEQIQAREKELANHECQTQIDATQQQLATSSLSLATLPGIRLDLNRLDQLRPLIDDTSRQAIRALHESIDRQATELFRAEGESIAKDIDSYIARARADLDSFTSLQEFNDWREFTYPQYTQRFAILTSECPIEAEEARQRIIKGRQDLQQLANTYQEKFETAYAKIREKSADALTQTSTLLKNEVNSFADRFRKQLFSSREEAEQYMGRSGALQQLSADIQVVAEKNPDTGTELDRLLKVTRANLLAEVERAGTTVVEKTGQQVVFFGKESFPKWEAPVKEHGADKQVALSFTSNETSKGPGVRAAEVMGDISLLVTNRDGHKEQVRLWEDRGEQEDVYRYGNASKALGESYVSKAEFDEIAQGYRDWEKGDASWIQQDLKQKREELGLRAVNQEIDNYYKHLEEESGTRLDRILRRKRSREDPALRALKTRQRELFGEYAHFYQEKHIGLYKHIDKIKNTPEQAYSNGKGFIPEWQSHWVVDEQTEAYLALMAQHLKMQGATHEGMLDLKGHAGTGKDVLVKMFCNRANRPYFTIDCSKWTTEFELSEDVSLEAEGGATRTIKVPSVVLQAITTPGAVMYFNEFNAMPEQAQIFLHGLFDEKRSLTLKTSSGKLIKAEKDVLFMDSRNPNYPGTFDPQFATKSRMVSMEVGYPPLEKPAQPDDSNRNPLIASSEPLRIAREVTSLQDLTYESNLEKNEFVQLWDKYVNGLDNGAPSPTTLQKFDLDIILALVQFGTTLREHFISKLEGTAEQRRKALPVTQPLTGREMRRAAYYLSHLDLVEKTDPEKTAREILERYYLSHFDKQEDRETVRTALATWPSSKRPR